ncbi:uncharacterized protein ASPGLDRAFT_66409 [Aspergillus glaucus CBS 516.65]|uniref:Isomerase YbhE n=1 Tax=Aspergillus glaucus CBS 516.65 TaxID=1160497 RepID=A0A1L9VJL1_ASPGL|nr:hypothetical protein ASPGLDRAFT_66409 [Aspergillus glaucus CBS 516.65]OJJ84116.1 hypothetical protein ASPGLDRAFT_66409 [Aspergillus glaucus CBS 516.65]
MAMASRLYAASYAGIVSTLSLAPASNGTGNLSVIAEFTSCGPSPSWLMLDGPHDILYCLDEGLNVPNGSIASFHTNANGSLTPIKHIETISGPVMSVLYSAPGVPGRKFIAVAHYDGSAVTTYSVDPITGIFNRSQTFNFHMDGPGPNAERQDAPHPHGAYLDPTGRYVLVPDLGADFVRIFEINQHTGQLKEVSPLVTKPGLGPRHLAFWTPKSVTGAQVANGKVEVYFYLVSELMNTLTGYKVAYSESGSMEFTSVYEESTFGGQKPGPDGSKASGIAISPTNNHIIVSNRLDSTFGPNNDSFATFSIANDSGTAFTKPSFLGLEPAYGVNPRQFEISPGKHQHLVAVALQDGEEVVVTRWDEKEGRTGALYAKKEMKGQIPAVVWDH